MRNVDLLVVGGGSAGMAAALEAKKNGISSILIVEKEDFLGGVLNQCIHNGFGLTEFNEELTGPEFMSRFIDQIRNENIEILLQSQVTNITSNKVVTISSKNNGIIQIHSKAIIFATGCYERNAGEIKLPGDRCAGIMTAGMAQKYINIHGFMCGKRAVILGSGDIGLIMARRLTLEGAKVVCVVELMPYSNGLNRNIQQCLIDYDIPLYLSTSVSKVIGKQRVEKVILSKVDENLNFIPNSEEEIDCDTLILSVGLSPYITPLKLLGCELGKNKGPVVNNYYQTSIDGIFSCGNCLHVHDIVDYVVEEARQAARGAVKYLNNELTDKRYIDIECGENVNYVIPSSFDRENNDGLLIKFRVKKPFKECKILIKCGEQVVFTQNKIALIPSEMQIIQIKNINLEKNTKKISVSVEGIK